MAQSKNHMKAQFIEHEVEWCIRQILVTAGMTWSQGK